jgi:hypothetical protein
MPQIYIVLLLLTGIVTGCSLEPHLVASATIGTLGLAMIVMMGAITLFVYLLALAPAVLFGGRVGVMLSAMLVAAVALGPERAARELLPQAEERITSSDVALEAPLADPIRVVGLVQNQADTVSPLPSALSLALLRGGMVASVLLLDQNGVVTGHVRDGPVPVVMRGQGAHGPAQLTIRVERTSERIVQDALLYWEEWALANTGMRQVIVYEGEGFTGPVLMSRTIVALTPPAVPTVFMPRMSRLNSDGLPLSRDEVGGIYPRPDERTRLPDDGLLLREAISTLGIPTGRAAPAGETAGAVSWSGPAKLAASRVVAVNMLDTGDSRRNDVQEAVLRWVSQLSNNDVTEEDLALMERAMPLMQSRNLGGAGVAIARNRLLWNTYRDRYVQSLAEGTAALPERTTMSITEFIASRGAPDGDAEALRPSLTRAAERAQAGPLSRETITTILAAAQVGMDAVPALEAIRLTGLDRDTQNDILDRMRYGLCAFPPDRREQIAPAIVPALRDILSPWRAGTRTEGRNVTPYRNALNALIFLQENGAQELAASVLGELPAVNAERAVAEMERVGRAC